MTHGLDHFNMGYIGFPHFDPKKSSQIQEPPVAHRLHVRGCVADAEICCVVKGLLQGEKRNAGENYGLSATPVCFKKKKKLWSLSRVFLIKGKQKSVKHSKCSLQI